MPVTTPALALFFPGDSENWLDRSTRDLDVTVSTNPSAGHKWPCSKTSALFPSRLSHPLLQYFPLTKRSSSVQSPRLPTEEAFSHLDAVSHRLPLSCFVRQSLPSALPWRILHAVMLGSLNSGCVCPRGCRWEPAACAAWGPGYGLQQAGWVSQQRDLLLFHPRQHSVNARYNQPALSHLLAGLMLLISNILNYTAPASNLCLLKEF